MQEEYFNEQHQIVELYFLLVAKYNSSIINYKKFLLSIFIANFKHKNNLNDLDIYLEIKKTNPKFEIEAKYHIALYYKKQKKYKEALDIAKEIPDNYRNIKIIMAYCNKEIGYDEFAFKLYEEITNKQIEDLKKEEKFNKVEQDLRVTKDRFKNDLEIWKYIKNEHEGLSEIADKKINKYNH
ncbi:3454_t:CDS:2, partial [Racocetra fulgida]